MRNMKVGRVRGAESRIGPLVDRVVRMKAKLDKAVGKTRNRNAVVTAEMHMAAVDLDTALMELQKGLAAEALRSHSPAKLAYYSC